jgi:hypothetical protein
MRNICSYFLFYFSIDVFSLSPQHGGGIRCKLAGCNRVAIGKMQLCRAHGGGSRAKVAPPTMEEQHETQDMEPVMLQPQLQAPAGDPNFQYQTQEHQQQQTSYYAGSI